MLPGWARAQHVYGGQLTDRIETGKVKKVSKQLVSFSPLAGGPVITVRIGPETQLSKHKKPAKLKQIKVGEFIRVWFSVGDGIVTAEKLTILDPKDIQRRK